MELEFHQIATKYTGLRISMPGYQARLTASLATEGQLHSVLVVQNAPETEGYVLIDGYRRVTALRTLNRDTVDAIVLPLCETEALVFRHCQESTHRRSALEDGWLLRDLVDLHGMSQAELSRRFQRSESWISRRLSLVRELPESAQELVRRGRLCDHAAMKYLVPLARAKRSDCEELVRNLTRGRISAKQMERIYMAWKGGDADRRHRVVQRPLLFLKTAEALKCESDKQSDHAIQAVSEDMEILSAVSDRARRRMRELEKGVCFPDTIFESWRAAQASFLALTTAMEKRVNAGQGNQNGDFAPQS